MTWEFTPLSFFMLFGCAALALLVYLFGWSGDSQSEEDGSDVVVGTAATPSRLQLDRIIYGLGNVGDKYKKTRHNVGLIVLDSIARMLNLTWKNIAEGQIAVINEGSTELPQIALFKANTYMNLSGKPLKSLMKRCNLNSMDKVMVIHDDLENSFGKVKIKNGGSAVGHRGVKSIISEMDTDEFKRVKVGIDRPKERDRSVISPYVLADFPEEQLLELNEKISKAAIDVLEIKPVSGGGQ